MLFAPEFSDLTVSEFPSLLVFMSRKGGGLESVN